MSDVCVVCHRGPGKVCPACLNSMDHQLSELPRRYATISGALAPRQTGPAERGAARVHAGLPLNENALSLLAPGGLPPILHPKIRHWQTRRKVEVTTYAPGRPPRTVTIVLTDWFSEPVTGTDGQPVMDVDDDQVGVIPPREWLDQHVRQIRTHLGHHVPARTTIRATRTYVPAVYRTLLQHARGPAVIAWLATTSHATGALERLAYRGLLSTPADTATRIERRGEPPRSIQWDVAYLRTWLEKACTEDAIDPAAFAAQLRALHAEITRVLGDTPDQTWVGRCPAFIATLDDTGQPTGRRKPCGAGLWQDNSAYVSAQVQCPRCSSTWDTRGHAGAGTAREIRRVWPIDRRRRYTADEVGRLRTPTCTSCGKRLTIRWRDVTGTRDKQRTWQPTGAVCDQGCDDARGAV